MQKESSESKKNNIVLEDIGTYVRRSGFNKSRQTYLASNGEYVYIKADGTKLCIPNTRENAEFIILLDEMDHEEDLRDSKEQTDHYTSFDDLESVANRYRIEERCVSYERISTIEDSESDVHAKAFPGTPEPQSHEEKVVRKTVEQCPERWQNYFFDVYGGTCKNQEEYRKKEVQETGKEKTLAAISKMDGLLKERVCEALGRPMPPKKRGRKG